jgi:hypothetical protein
MMTNQFYVPNLENLRGMSDSSSLSLVHHTLTMPQP